MRGPLNQQRTSEEAEAITDGRPQRMLFQQLGHPSALSPGSLGMVVVLTVSALGIVALELWKWGTQGGALSLALLWAPMGAYGAWLRVESEHDGSPSGWRGLAKIGTGLTLFFGLLFVYGFHAWYWNGGDPWLPAFSLLYVLLTWGARRRRRRRPPESRAV